MSTTTDLARLQRIDRAVGRYLASVDALAAAERTALPSGLIAATQEAVAELRAAYAVGRER